MKIKAQKLAFERELHGLCMRYLNEFDLNAEELLDFLAAEEFFLIAMCVSLAEDDGLWDQAEDEEFDEDD